MTTAANVEFNRPNGEWITLETCPHISPFTVGTGHHSLENKGDKMSFILVPLMGGGRFNGEMV